MIHTVSSSCFFVDLDHSSVCAQFGESLKTPLDQYETWQKVCLKVYKEIRAQGSALFAPVVGVTFASQHRGTGGRNFAVFEEFRDKVLSRGITRPLDAESLKQAIKRLPV